MRILCFGDSNTYGYDPRDGSDGRYPAEARWVELLAQQTGWMVRNRGENGRTIPCHPKLLAQTERMLQANRSTDLVIVMLGTNDLLQGADALETAARMERFLTHILPHCQKLLLVAPPPMYPGQWVTEERLMVSSAQLGPVYEEISTRLGIPFADAAAWNIEMAYAGVHFSESGNQAFASALARCLQQFSFPELG